MPRVRTAPLDITAPTEASARAPRTASDRCPTAIALHPAADGLIARVRLPGGRLTAAQAALLAGWAAPGASVELTVRGNLQLRGLRAEQAGPLAAALHAAGLLPSEPHDQARTIVTSPLAGRLARAAPADALVRAIDAALCAEPELTALSGRFLIAVDDGLGSVDLAGADVAVALRAPTGLAGALAGAPALLLVGGHPAGLISSGADTDAVGAPGDVVAVANAVVAAARAFVRAAGGAAWRVRELTGGGRALAAELVAAGVVARVRAPALQPPAALPPLGAGRQADGRAFVRALPPLGRLTGAQLAAVAALAEAAHTELRLASDRSITCPDVALQRLAPLQDGLAAAGLVVEECSPAIGLTACAGLGCSTSRGDVRAAARLRLHARPEGAPPEHLVGCERRCGAPPPGAGTTFVMAERETPEAMAERVAAGHTTQETER